MMKNKLAIAALFAIILIAPNARSEYTKAEWERMKTGEILISEITAQNPDGSQRTQFLARLYVKSTREQAYKIMRDYNHFGDFMPKLVKCTILKQEGERYWVRYETKVMWMEVNYHLVLDGVEPNKKIVYKLDATKKNDIRAAEGFWIFEDTPDGSGIIVSYSSNVDTGVPAPEAVAKKVAKSSFPEIVSNARKRIESGGTWKKPQGT